MFCIQRSNKLRLLEQTETNSGNKSTLQKCYVQPSILMLELTSVLNKVHVFFIIFIDLINAVCEALPRNWFNLLI